MGHWCPAALTNFFLPEWNITFPCAFPHGVLPARALPILAAQCKLLQHMGAVAALHNTPGHAVSCALHWAGLWCSR